MKPCTSQITRYVIRPAAAMSVKKCPPNAMRSTPVARPNKVAAAYASGRHAGGVSAAGAKVQNAVALSPEKNEQLRPQPPCGSHHATAGKVPPNSVTSTGRGRPQ